LEQHGVATFANEVAKSVVIGTTTRRAWHASWSFKKGLWASQRKADFLRNFNAVAVARSNRQNVLVRSWNEYQCPVCNAGFVGGVVLVRDGVFHQVLALRDGDVDRILGPYRGKADIVIVREDGTYWPREDWFDKTLEYHSET
jgi:hypothetical protein